MVPAALACRLPPAAMSPTAERFRAASARLVELARLAGNSARPGRCRCSIGGRRHIALLNTGLITEAGRAINGVLQLKKSYGADGTAMVSISRPGPSMTNDGRITGGAGSGSAYFSASQIARSPTAIFSGGLGGGGVVLETGASLVNNGSIFGGGASFASGAPGNGGAGAWHCTGCGTDQPRPHPRRQIRDQRLLPKHHLWGFRCRCQHRGWYAHH